MLTVPGAITNSVSCRPGFLPFFLEPLKPLEKSIILLLLLRERKTAELLELKEREER